MRLYLIRHGETLFNQKKCYYGHLDAGLSEKGREQAKRLGRFFDEIPLDYVISSPLVRAVDTAKYIIGERNLLIHTDERLMEQNFGIFEGKTMEEILLEYPEEWKAWNHNFSHHHIAEGESFFDVRERIDNFLGECCKKYDGNVLITAHKGTLGHILASLLSMPLNGYWNFVFDQGCYNIVDIQDGYAIIRCLNVPVEKAD